MKFLRYQCNLEPVKINLMSNKCSKTVLNNIEALYWSKKADFLTFLCRFLRDENGEEDVDSVAAATLGGVQLEFFLEKNPCSKDCDCTGLDELLTWPMLIGWLRLAPSTRISTYESSVDPSPLEKSSKLKFSSSSRLCWCC